MSTNGRCKGSATDGKQHYSDICGKLILCGTVAEKVTDCMDPTPLREGQSERSMGIHCYDAQKGIIGVIPLQERTHVLIGSMTVQEQAAQMRELTLGVMGKAPMPPLLSSYGIIRGKLMGERVDCAGRTTLPDLNSTLSATAPNVVPAGTSDLIVSVTGVSNKCAEQFLKEYNNDIVDTISAILDLEVLPNLENGDV